LKIGVRGRSRDWEIGVVVTLVVRGVMRWLGVMAVGVLLAACGGRETPAPAATSTPAAVTAAPLRIVAMGDSLTEGFGVATEEAYPAQLARRLTADGYNVEVINAGISGETTSGALSRVNWVLGLEPAIVILATGGNDGLRGIEPELTASNLDQLVTAFQDAGVTVLLAGMEMVENMGAEYTTAFRAIYPTVSAAHDVTLIPFLLEGVATDPTLNQPDFIHPTAEGYTVVVDTIYPYVTDLLADAQPQN
jgi:acyl-CoA thioesterase-1